MPIAITLYTSDGKLLDANKACLDLINVSNVADIRGFDIFNDPNMPKDVKENLVQKGLIGINKYKGKNYIHLTDKGIKVYEKLIELNKILLKK